MLRPDVGFEFPVSPSAGNQEKGCLSGFGLPAVAQRVCRQPAVLSGSLAASIRPWHSTSGSEAENLSQYGRRCHDEPVTVNGVPAFQLVPFSEDDDLIDSRR